MTSVEKKAKIRNLNECLRLEDRINALRSENVSIEHMIKSLNDFKIDANKASYEELKSTLEKNKKDIESMIEKGKAIMTAMDKLENPLERKVILMRYLDGSDWERIAKSLRYSRTQVNRIHDAALEHIAI